MMICSEAELASSRAYCKAFADSAASGAAGAAGTTHPTDVAMRQTSQVSAIRSMAFARQTRIAARGWSSRCARPCSGSPCSGSPLLRSLLPLSDAMTPPDGCHPMA